MLFIIKLPILYLICFIHILPTSMILRIEPERVFCTLQSNILDYDPSQ